MRRVSDTEREHADAIVSKVAVEVAGNERAMLKR